MLPGQKYTPTDIWRIMWRRKWLLVAPLVVGAAAAAALLRYLPDIYRAETTILVVSQRVPVSVVRATGTANIEDRLLSISQQLMSRSRLEPIITEFGLYTNQRAVMPMEDVVQRMRQEVDIQTLRGDTFVLRYSATDPDVARKVTERLASLFIEENVRERETQSDATSQFLDTQLEDSRRRLVETEKRLEDFRVQYAGELPTQAQGNLQTIQTLQLQLQNLNESLARDRDRRLSLVRTLGDTPTGPSSDETPAAPVQATTPGEEPITGTAAQRLAVMQQGLANLRLRLTPEHPDVVRAERIIKDLEVEVVEEEKAGGGPSGRGPVRSTAEQRRTTLLRDELEQISRDIRARERQISQVQGQIGLYRSKVNVAPVRESEMTELMRDYETINRVYTDLLAKREESKVAADAERRQIGEQFRVLEPARRPERPLSPNRPAIASGGIAGGLLLGLLLIGGLELRNQTLRTEANVLDSLNLPVLATVPRMRNAAERRRHLRNLVSASAVGVVAVAVAAAAVWRWLK